MNTSLENVVRKRRHLSVYKLKEIRDPLMVRILEKILMGYDDLISERLSQTTMYPSRARKGLTRHLRKGDPEGGSVVAARFPKKNIARARGR